MDKQQGGQDIGWNHHGITSLDMMAKPLFASNPLVLDRITGRQGMWRQRILKEELVLGKMGSRQYTGPKLFVPLPSDRPRRQKVQQRMANHERGSSRIASSAQLLPDSHPWSHRTLGPPPIALCSEKLRLRLRARESDPPDAVAHPLASSRPTKSLGILSASVRS